MDRAFDRRHGLAAALIIILVLLPSGCGKEVTTSPEFTHATEIAPPPGEVILPGPGDGKLSRPRDFKAESLGGCTVLLTWSVPDYPCDAVLTLNGMVLSRQDAASGVFLDMCGKTPGTHTYELKYSIGAAMGPVEARSVTINQPIGDGTGGEKAPGPEQG